MADRPLRSAPRAAFTLIEIMVVVACAMLVILPVMNVMRAGTQASFQGMQQIDTVLAGRRVLERLTRDLRAACLDTRDFPPLNSRNEEVRYGLRNILRKKETTAQLRYVFLQFPQHSPISDCVPGFSETGGPSSHQGLAYRQASEVEYLLEKGQPGKTPGKLWRIERLSGKETKALLADQVAEFSIRTLGGGDRHWSNKYFFITLQLHPGVNPASPGAVSPPLDFFDVAAPDFFTPLENQPSNRLNWHSRLQGPSDPPLYLNRDFDKNL